MPFNPRPLPPASELWERYSYNPLTGELFSLKRPTSKKPLGHIEPRGYVRARVRWWPAQSIAMHRLIWKWVYGVDPVDTIDHINKCKSDNRIWNLRDVDMQTQNRNKTNTLTAAEVATIKRLLAAGYGQSELARLYGMSKNGMHMIASGRNWKDISADTHQAAPSCDQASIDE